MTSLFHMFSGASAFNGDVSTWNTSQVTDMTYMFQVATAFDQEVSAWDVSKLQWVNAMFTGVYTPTCRKFSVLKAWPQHLTVQLEDNWQKARGACICGAARDHITQLSRNGANNSDLTVRFAEYDPLNLTRVEVTDVPLTLTCTTDITPDNHTGQWVSRRANVSLGTWQLRCGSTESLMGTVAVVCEEGYEPNGEGGCRASACASTESNDWAAQSDGGVSKNSQLIVTLNGTHLPPNITVYPANSTREVSMNRKGAIAWASKQLTLPLGSWEVAYESDGKVCARKRLESVQCLLGYERRGENECIDTRSQSQLIIGGVIGGSVVLALGSLLYYTVKHPAQFKKKIVSFLLNEGSSKNGCKYFFVVAHSDYAQNSGIPVEK